MKINILNTINENEDVFLQILKNKDLSLEWLNAGEQDLLDGKLLRNYQKGKELLLKHINNNSKIGILVDNDYDGISSAAIMYQWIIETFNYQNLIPILTEGKVHGIIESTIPDIDFLIIPDASSSEIKQHKNLSVRGIEILILDHHEMTQKESEYAIIINPQNPLCEYPNKNLSGAGVVWKFIETIDKENGKDTYKKYTDLAASALIADVMSLKSIENKAIINIGLKNINNIYLKAYLKGDSRVKDKTMNPILISFYFAPQINALIRMGGIEEKKELFEAITGQVPAEPVVAQLIKTKGKQDRKKDSVIPRIVFNLQQQGRDQHKVIIGESPNTLPSSMTGLTAGILANMYKKPCLLGKEKEGKLIGSLRSLNDSNIENFKDFCEESKLFEWVAGHQAAAGFSIKNENIDKFLDYANKHLPPFEKVYNVDFRLKGDKGTIIKEASKLIDHVGCDISELLIYDEINVLPSDFNIMGKNQNTLKIIKNGITYIKFGSGAEEIPEKPCTMRIVGAPNMNEWMGQVDPQVSVKEWEIIELQL